MAILTRATGIILVGVVGLALLVRVIREITIGQSPFSTILRASSDGLIWLTSTISTIFLLLPALWVAPRGTIQKLWSWSSNAATEGHENPTFFRGIHNDDPGLAVYPIVLIWRTSPVEWIGISLLIILGYWGWQHRSGITGRSFALLSVTVIFALVYVAAMATGAKKFDRYILPVFPVIALVAAHGLMLGKAWISKRGGRGWGVFSYGALSMLLVAQFISWGSAGPYRLDYYNPLLGGSEKAKDVLQMGWGQGGDQVVSFLIDQTEDGPINVQTSAVPSAFTYFLTNDSPIRFQNFGLGTPAGWYETDYYVAGIQQTQRGLAPWYGLLEHYDPIHTVKIGGVEYFEIYNVRHLPLPEQLQAPTACNYTFGEEITLMQIIGREETIDFYFLTTAAGTQSPLEFTIDIGPTGGEQMRESVDLLPDTPGIMNRVTIHYAKNDSPLSDATISIAVSTNSTELPVSAPWSSDIGNNATTSSECFYTDPPGVQQPRRPASVHYENRDPYC